MTATELMADIVLSVKLGLHFKEIQSLCHNNGVHNLDTIKAAYVHAYKLANNNA